MEIELYAPPDEDWWLILSDTCCHSKTSKFTGPWLRCWVVGLRNEGEHFSSGKYKL